MKSASGGGLAASARLLPPRMLLIMATRPASFASSLITASPGSAYSNIGTVDCHKGRASDQTITPAWLPAPPRQHAAPQDDRSLLLERNVLLILLGHRAA